MLKYVFTVSLVLFSGAAFAQKQVDCSKMSPAEVRMVDDVTTTCKRAVKTPASVIKLAINEAKGRIADSFKDPDAVKFRNLRISQDGQLICGELNAKNSYGGYNGFKSFYAAWEAGRVSVEGDDRFDSVTNAMLCDFAKTKPFK